MLVRNAHASSTGSNAVVSYTDLANYVQNSDAVDFLHGNRTNEYALITIINLPGLNL